MILCLERSHYFLFIYFYSWKGIRFIRSVDCAEHLLLLQQLMNLPLMGDQTANCVTRERRRGESQRAAAAVNASTSPSRRQNDWGENRGLCASFFLWLNKEFESDWPKPISSLTQILLQRIKIRFKLSSVWWFNKNPIFPFIKCQG